MRGSQIATNANQEVLMSKLQMPACRLVCFGSARLQTRAIAEGEFKEDDVPALRYDP